MSKKMPFSLPGGYIKLLHPPANSEEKSSCFIFQESQLLVHKETCQIPLLQEVPHVKRLYIGMFKEHHYFAALEASAPEGFEWRDLRYLYGHLDEEIYALAGRGLQLVKWHNSHLFCGVCGAPTKAHAAELARECSSCGFITYPRISPAIIAIIRKAPGQILLARSPHFPACMYSAIAGFVEPGETLEQALHREIYEEVGLKVTNVRYISSQPWPFPHSLMMGFLCDWQEGEIQIDKDEIEDAQWFTKEHLPLIPTSVSIASYLIHKAFEAPLD